MIVESGNLATTPDKLSVVAAVLADLNYDAVGIGETDLRVVGEEFFKRTHESKLTVLDCSPDAHESTKPYVVRNVGGVKVGIISFGAVIPDPNRPEYEFRRTMYSAYKAAREGSDILILLDQGNVATKEWLERNAERLGAPDVVVAGVAKTSLANMEVLGRTHVVPTSIRGRQVGVVDIALAPGKEPTFTLQRIELDPKVPEDQAISARIQQLLPSQPLAQQPHGSAPNTPGPPDLSTLPKQYYPARLCKNCHVKEYDDWATTAHARAIKDLADRNKTTPECMPCHSDMYVRLQRVSIPADGIGGVECGSCHANALPHGMERKQVAQKTRVDPAVCLVCHDKVRSPNFDVKTYLPQVAHASAKSAESETSLPLPPEPSPPD